MAGLRGLRKQVVQSPFVRGLNTRDDPKLLQLGTLTSMVNLEINRVGRLDTRRGISQVAGLPPAVDSTSPADASLAAAIARDSDLVVVGDRNVNAWDPTASTYRYRGRAPGPALTSRVVQSNQFTSLTMQDCAALSGILVVASIEAPNYDTVANGGATVGNRLRVDVFNEVGGESLASWVYSNPWGITVFESFPICVASASHLYVIWAGRDAAGYSIRLGSIVVAPGSIGAAPTMHTASYTNYAFSDSGNTLSASLGKRLVVDACAWPEQDAAMIVFPAQLDGGGNGILPVKLDSTGAYTSLTLLSGSARTGISICLDTNLASTWFIAASSGIAIYGILFNGSNTVLGYELLVSDANVYRLGTVCMGKDAAASDQFAVVYEMTNDPSLDPFAQQVRSVKKLWVDAAGNVITNSHPIYNACLVSKPVLRAGGAYCLVGDQRGVTYHLVDLDVLSSTSTTSTETAEPVGSLSPFNCGGPWGQFVGSNTAVPPASIYAWADSRHVTSLVTSSTGSQWYVAFPYQAEPLWQWVNYQPQVNTDDLQRPDWYPPFMSAQLASKVATFDFAAGVRGVSTEGQAYLAGAQVKNVDPAMASEAGFPFNPWKVNVTPASGGSISAGQRGYTAVYAFMHADGRLERSAPATPIIATFSDATTTASFTVPTAYNAALCPSVSTTFTQPAVGAQVLVTVSNATVMASSNWYIHGGGSYTFASILTPTTVYLTNTGAPYNAAPSTAGIGSGQTALTHTAVVPVSSLSPFSIGDTISIANAGTWAVKDKLTAQSSLVLVWNGDGTRADGTPVAAGDTIASGTTVAAATLFKATVSLPALTLTGKQTSAHPNDLWCAEIYRTLPSGDTYYLVGRVSAAYASAGQLQFVDLLGDDYLATQEQLGQQVGTAGGAQLPHFQPMAAASMCEHKKRVILGGCEDGYTVQYSAALVEGESAWFNPLLAIPFPEQIVAVASMDDGLYAFSTTGIWYVAGDGPDETGANDNWTQPVRIQSDVGCIDPRSVVVLPMGIMFQSQRGVYLLDRNRMVSYAGAGVESSLTGSTLVTSAVLCQDRRHVRFTLLSGKIGQTDSFFYEYAQWGTSRYAAFDSSSLKATSACVIGTSYWMAGSDGNLYQESSGYADADGSVIATTVTTGWVALSQQLGWQRTWWVQFLAEYAGPCSVTMTTVSDYDPTATDVTTWASTTARQLAQHLWNTQKGNAIRVTISVTPATETAGAQYDTLGFEMGMRSSGMKQLPPAQRGG